TPEEAERDHEGVGGTQQKTLARLAGPQEALSRGELAPHGALDQPTAHRHLRVADFVLRLAALGLGLAVFGSRFVFSFAVRIGRASSALACRRERLVSVGDSSGGPTSSDGSPSLDDAPLLAAVPSAAAAPFGPTPGNTGASPSVPSGVTMIECGRPSGPPLRPRISSVFAPPGRFIAVFFRWFFNLSLSSLPPF